LGSLGGKKGGKAKTAKLTPEERKEIDRKAAKARWEEGYANKKAAEGRLGRSSF
jgi:hypothetical protein